MNRKLVVTDNLLALCNDAQFENLSPEIEARWKLVEDTWTSNKGVQFDIVQYAIDTQTLIVESRTTYRRDLSKARDALSGYQRGRCFYCFSDIFIQDVNTCDVDHFLPFHLRYKIPIDLNGVWNLVLSCESCNRGSGTGKHGRLPHKTLLKRLILRNNYLVNSHHPLSNTLIAQTGATDEVRSEFLNKIYNLATTIHKDTWEPKEVRQFIF
jgi:5-methylcytosine-specific restriction endonuclease McrA